MGTAILAGELLPLLLLRTACRLSQVAVHFMGSVAEALLQLPRGYLSP